MSYEDSFEREAADERRYQGFERWYVFEHLRPLSIGMWEWRLMFEKERAYPSYAEAAADAKDMARELGRCVIVRPRLGLPGYFEARPDDYYDRPTGSFWTTYPTKRAKFIEALVTAGQYPDLVRIAREMNDPDQGGISRHYFSDVSKHHERLRPVGEIVGPMEPLFLRLRRA